jgi:molybdopterin-guanine dinucleotide biosynthesis protein A
MTGLDAGATGVVLAGGRARRFGRDKLVEDLGGSPLLHHAVGRLAQVCGSVVVVIAPDAPEPTLPEGVAVRLVRDEVADEGPLRGAAAGLSAAETDWGVLAGGDMPDLQPPVLEEMLRLAREAETSVVLSDDGRARPLPIVLLRRPALEAAQRLLLAGRRSLHDLLEAVPLTVVPEEAWTALDPERRTLRDVDEPSDLLDQG